MGSNKSRVIFYGWLALSIALACTVFFQFTALTDQHNKQQEIQALYEEKTNDYFLEMLANLNSFRPLVKSLTEISAIHDMKDRIHNQKVLDLAKEQASQVTNQLILLIQAADLKEQDQELRHRVNNLIMTSQQQEDVAFLAFQADLWRTVYNTSSRYWLAKPQVIDRVSLEANRDAAVEMANLDKTMQQFKERANEMRKSDRYLGMQLDFITLLKKDLLKALVPHLKKLTAINESFNKRETVG
ncbi:hypothetical protein [Paenibacillus lignilyticus]|uniref:Chemotaxis methyl-accepting receptor HlyB-like 4HB MCP domain-containing protein n=1 Tax=Paenibacillus lignilyticus TaxID=1172615 RepID=A0ABS5CDS8_9BACL|nr:hypothetical protein [Paenibacillus lignilyticus]MBP3963897.1 hypothetical protein [Paenibacillus lignilyticus]